MADTQILAPLDNAPARLPVPAFAGRFAPFTQVFRQPAVQRALPAIATSAAIAIAALAWFMTQSAPQTQLFAGLADADKAAVAGAPQAPGIGHTIHPVTGALTVDAGKPYPARIAPPGQGLHKSQPSGARLIASSTHAARRPPK